MCLGSKGREGKWVYFPNCSRILLYLTFYCNTGQLFTFDKSNMIQSTNNESLTRSSLVSLPSKPMFFQRNSTLQTLHNRMTSASSLSFFTGSLGLSRLFCNSLPTLFISNLRKHVAKDCRSIATHASEDKYHNVLRAFLYTGNGVVLLIKIDQVQSGSEHVAPHPRLN